MGRPHLPDEYRAAVEDALWTVYVAAAARLGGHPTEADRDEAWDDILDAADRHVDTPGWLHARFGELWAALAAAG